MDERTWPYGTQLRAKVLERTKATHAGKVVDMLVLQDRNGEGHIILGTSLHGEAGESGTLVFTQGGPSGGYWKFTPDEEPTP